MSRTIVLLAHGSPDPRHRTAIEAQARRLEARHGSPVRCAYLETDAPDPGVLGTELTGEVVVVPMLITPAYHARVDAPQAARSLAGGGAQVSLTPPLAPDPLLIDAVTERLTSVGATGEDVVLVAGGSSSGQAAASLARLVADHAPSTWVTTTLADLDADLLDNRPTVVPFVLAGGVLHDKVGDLCARTGAHMVPGGLLGTGALDVLVARRAGLQ